MVSAEFVEAEYQFYGALARVSAAESAIAEERQELLANAARSHQRLLEWAANCPENFDSRAALVGAELAASMARTRRRASVRPGDQIGATNRFVHIEARERAGRTFLRCPRLRDECDRTKEARSCYLRWGADGKVRQLDQHYPHLFPQERVSDSRSAISEHIERLELETVLKAYKLCPARSCSNA